MFDSTLALTSSALDVVQDATLKIVRNGKPMQTVEDWDRWVRRVVLNTALDHLRGDRRRTRHETQQRHQASAFAPKDEGATPEDIEQLTAALATLSATERNLLTLRYGDGKTLTEVGNASGMGPGAVDGRLRRLLRRLANAMGVR